MNKNKHTHFTLIPLFSFVIFFQPLFAQTIDCGSADYDALKAFYEATNGDDWTNKWDINNCDICNWYGISCDENDNIIKIDLNNNNLVGTLPPQIAALSTLEVLALGNNFLKGAIPAPIGNLTKLKTLILFANQLSGPIPSELGNLSQLSKLWLNQNALSGFIPSELGKLTSLEEIILEDNQLSGSIPAQFGNLKLGLTLSLKNNLLSGELPPALISFGSNRVFPSLERIGSIDVSNNQLSGCYPEAYKAFCTSLIVFRAKNNPKLPLNGDFNAICNGQEKFCSLPPTNSANCDNLKFSSENNSISVAGLTTKSSIEIIGEKTDWQVIPICLDDCSNVHQIPDLEAGTYTVKIQLVGADHSYCYLEKKIVVSNEVVPVPTDCNQLIFKSDATQIAIAGLNPEMDRVELLGKNTNWNVITICDRDCDQEQIIPNLKEGNYVVKIHHGLENNAYCYREEIVQVAPNNIARSNDKIHLASFQKNQKTALDIFPNPVLDRLNLYHSSLIDKEGSITIVNTFGQVIMKKDKVHFADLYQSINIDFLDNGFYVLLVKTTDNQLLKRKFVVGRLY